MKSLHINTALPSEELASNENFLEKFDQNVQILRNYIQTFSSHQSSKRFSEHEEVVLRLTQNIGKEALSETLMHYDVNAPTIKVDDKKYRKKHLARMRYQTLFGDITLQRHMYAERKSGERLCPMECQTGIIHSYWTPKAAENAVFALAHHLKDKHKQNTVLPSVWTYLMHNRHRMKYAELREKNYPIGSGIVEAACKSLVNQRMKRSGMSWQNTGGQAILTFRALVKSNLFEKAWLFVANAYLKTVSIDSNVLPFQIPKTH